jgi:hypothetical protein
MTFSIMLLLPIPLKAAYCYLIPFVVKQQITSTFRLMFAAVKIAIPASTTHKGS